MEISNTKRNIRSDASFPIANGLACKGSESEPSRVTSGAKLRMARLVASMIMTALGVGLTACAPKQTNRVYKDHALPAGARVSDPELNFDTVHQSSTRVSAMLRWNGQVQAHDFFSATEELLTLSQIRSDSALSRLAISMQDSYYAQPNVLFSKSP